MKYIDLNSDVGEGIVNEAMLMPFLSSCNISCGLHAGDDQTIKSVIELAKKHKVSVGAHPSFDDRANFGRKEMHLEKDELKHLIKSQVTKLKAFCKDSGIRLAHVKPHGALYNLAANSAETSQVIIDSILETDSNLKLFGLANSETAKVADGKIPFIPEGFVDRKYASGSELMARSDGGLITDSSEILKQIHSMLDNGVIITPKGAKEIQVATICLHGDTPGSEKTVEMIYKSIMELGYQIRSPR